MGKKRKRSTPLVTGLKSRRKAREVTTTFHVLMQERERLEREGKHLADIDRRIEAIGGRSTYQDASIVSTSFHKTSKWVFSVLTEFGLRPKKGEPKMRVFEVGAINAQLLTCKWMDVYAIDLLSRHPRIVERDFFDVPPRRDYDVLVQSMVINNIDPASKRGEMLVRCAAHLKPGGLMFLMLPRLCIEKSMYLERSRFIAILRSTGFDVVKEKETPKVAFFCLRRQVEDGETNGYGKTEEIQSSEGAQCDPEDVATPVRSTHPLLHVSANPVAARGVLFGDAMKEKWMTLCQKYQDPPRPMHGSRGGGNSGGRGKKLTNPFAISFRPPPSWLT